MRSWRVAGPLRGEIGCSLGTDDEVITKLVKAGIPDMKSATFKT